MPLPALTRAQMIEVDRIMTDELGIALLQMMENAGRNLARLALDRYRPQRITVLAGSGGNGGGGMVAARHLANTGFDVTVVTTRHVGELTGAARRQAEILGAIGTGSSTRFPVAPGDLILDALVGYSLSGALRGSAGRLVGWALGTGVPILSLDVPSGVDVDGEPPEGPVIAADATMTLALPKQGLLGSPYVGDLFVADISVPPSVYERFGLEVPIDIFAAGSVVSV